VNTLILRGVFLALIVVMAGCKITKKTSPLPPQAAIFPAEEILKHKQAIQAQPNWSFQGRVAFKQGNDGGSARIEWLQRGDNLYVDLSAPISRKSVRISAIDGQPMCIEGLEPRPLCGDQAQAKLSQAIGEMPSFFMLKDWVRGLPVPADTMVELGFQPAVTNYDDEGKLASLSQQGWQIDYQTWHPAAAAQPSLPKRLQALKEDIRLRLVIDRWTWGADGAH